MLFVCASNILTRDTDVEPLVCSKTECQRGQWPIWRLLTRLKFHNPRLNKYTASQDSILNITSVCLAKVMLPEALVAQVLLTNTALCIPRHNDDLEKGRGAKSIFRVRFGCGGQKAKVSRNRGSLLNYYHSRIYLHSSTLQKLVNKLGAVWVRFYFEIQDYLGWRNSLASPYLPKSINFSHPNRTLISRGD